MGLSEIWKLTKTLVTLADDLKKSREEVKTLSGQVNILTNELLELKVRFKIFSESEFKAFTEQETLKREKFSEAEKYEREKFVQDIRNAISEAEKAALRKQVEELSKPPSKRGPKKQLSDGKTQPQDEGD